MTVYENCIHWRVCSRPCPIDINDCRHFKPDLTGTYEWVKNKSMIYCSNCASGWDAGHINDFKYCPNCGVRIIRSE